MNMVLLSSVLHEARPQNAYRRLNWARDKESTIYQLSAENITLFKLFLEKQREVKEESIRKQFNCFGTLLPLPPTSDILGESGCNTSPLCALSVRLFCSGANGLNLIKTQHLHFCHEPSNQSSTVSRNQKHKRRYSATVHRNLWLFIVDCGKSKYCIMGNFCSHTSIGVT
jgi:hypothetical protein